MNSFKTCIYVKDSDGEEHETVVRVFYDCTYDPGKLSGPWEDSYPPSGEMELTAVESIHELPLGITDNMVEQAAADSAESLEEEAWEHYHGGVR